MPKYAKRRGKKRVYKRRKAMGRRRGTAVARAVPSRGISLPFPDRFNCTMKFSNIFRLNQATYQIPIVQQYRLNHLYDPNYTDTTGRNNQQPMYYDTMTALYENYTVYGVQVTVRASGNADAYVFMRPMAGTTALPVNTILEMERPGTAWGMSHVGARPLYLKRYYDIGKIFGENKTRVLTEDNYHGNNSTTLPTNIAYLNIGTEAADPSTNIGMNLQVQFKFFVQWHKRREPAES